MIASHFRLLTDNFAETFRFYNEVVGLPTGYPPDSAGPYAEFELGGDKYLGLFDRELMLEALGLTTGGDRSPNNETLLCVSVDDVDAHARHLQEIGVELVAPPADHEPWGMRTVYIRDPEGNLIEFYGPLSTASE
jgi:predicted enzyme related to lactoylglutathione lyase